MSGRLNPIRYGVVSYGVREESLGTLHEAADIIQAIDFILEDEDPEIMLQKLNQFKDNLL